MRTIGLLVILVAASLIVASTAIDLAFGEMPAPADGECALQTPLTPRVVPGLPWDRHRHWLEGAAIPEGTRYVVVNEDSERGYHWTFWGNAGGKARFGVSTRWTWLNRGWDAQRWVLLYDCGPTVSAAIAEIDR